MAPGQDNAVNTTAAGHQTAPHLIRLADGRVVTVWASHGQDGSSGTIVARASDGFGGPGGAEAQVNTSTAGAQIQATGTATTQGHWVAWTGWAADGDGYGIFAQRYGTDGTALGGEFQVNAIAAGHQWTPTLTTLSSGQVLAAWASRNEDGDGWGIAARIFDADGTPATGGSIVNATTAGAQTAPAVAALNTGRSAIVWGAEGVDGSSSAVVLRLFDATGAPEGAEITVNTTTAGAQSAPAVATLADGSLVVAWESTAPGSNDTDVHLQRLSADGAKIGAEVTVNSTTADRQRDPAIAALDTGGFVVVWESFDQDGDGIGIYARRYAANGSAEGGEFRVTETTQGNQEDPSVIALSGGAFLVAWHGPGHDSDGDGIAQRLFDPGLLPLGAPVIAGTAALGTVLGVDVAALDDVYGLGALSYRWLRDGTAITGATGPTYTIGAADSGANLTVEVSYTSGAHYAETTRSAALPVPEGGVDQTGAGGNDTLTGSVFADTLSGKGGADVVMGQAGDDQLRGQNGDDTVVGDAGADRLYGGAGADMLLAGSGADTLRGGTQDDQIEGGGGNDALDGDAGNDDILGNGGVDVIGGGSGADVLRGHQGADELRGGRGGDDLHGGDGADQLWGGNADDRLWGGAGSDTLWGGNGNDRHWGDGGADRFVFDGNDGNDVIVDWGTGADMIEITNGAYSIADLAIDQVGGDTEVSFAGTRITLEGVDAATVGAEDFWFS